MWGEGMGCQAPHPSCSFLPSRTPSISPSQGLEGATLHSRHQFFCSSHLWGKVWK